MKKLLATVLIVFVMVLPGCKPKQLPVIMELGLSSCNHCTDMKKVLDQVQEENNGKIKVIFYDLDTPKGKELGYLYDVKNIPTTLFFDEKGNQYFKADSILLKEQVEAILKSHNIK